MNDEHLRGFYCRNVAQGVDSSVAMSVSTGSFSCTGMCTLMALWYGCEGNCAQTNEWL
jgi:hypothetical protein